jgi:DNA replication protein DnaC
MSAPQKPELKESLKKLWLSEFAEQYAIQGALAASEGWSYEQYLQRLCDLELQERESRKRQKLMQAA